jgi:hypothetical protein
MTMETLIMTKLSNKTLHELGMIDDSTQDEFTFVSLADEYAVERKKKYKNSRKYSAEKSAQYRARRLAKKAREERIAIESGAVEALYHQQSYNKKYDNGEPIS